MLPYAIRVLDALKAVSPPKCNYCGFIGTSSKEYILHEEECSGVGRRYYVERRCR